MASLPDQRNWLSFSLYPTTTTMDQQQQQQQNLMMTSPSQQQQQFTPFEATVADSSSSQYLVDNFYNGYPYSNSKPHMDFQFLNQLAAPKRENFLYSSSMVQYTVSQTDTQDSTLTTHKGSAYFNQATEPQTFKIMASTDGGGGGSKNHTNAFSTNSGSEVVDEFESAKCPQRLVGYSQQTESLAPGLNINKNREEKGKSIVAAVDSSTKSFGQRTSIYRGVTRHRWTGRYEAHLWDNSCRREGQARKGRQVYLGGYDKEDKAARAYDLAALKYWGPTATTNLPVANYVKEIEEMKHMTKQEFIASLRRKSSGFSRGASIYRGVTRHHQQGRWQARIGRVAGNKDLYLGTFATEEEAAEAYDIAAIKFRGINAVTNFEMNRYDVEAISNSTLPIGGAAKRLKSTLESEQKALVSVALNEPHLQNNRNSSSANISFNLSQPMPAIPYGIPFDGMPTLYQQNLYQQMQSNHSAPLTMSVPLNSANSSVGTNAGPITFMPNPADYYVWPNQSY